jgi:hypothetical protein
VHLDFIVIGAGKSGTTSLWEHLRWHPQIWMPPGKEEPFFSEDRRYARGLPWLMREVFAPAPAGAVLGKATPHYMSGTEDAPPQICAARIAATIPDVKLVALLRDPVDRAVSQHRHAMRRSAHPRPFEDVAVLLLEPAQLHAARNEAHSASRYVVNGEYGRILAAYAAAFPREQLLVMFTDELAEDPAGVLDRVCDFIGVEGFHPEGLEVRHHKGASTQRVPQAAMDDLIALLIRSNGSRPRRAPDRAEVLGWLNASVAFGEALDAEARSELLRYLDKEIWAQEPSPGGDRYAGVRFWLENVWNPIPDRDDPTIDPEVRDALREHYRKDLELLEKLLGVEPPWEWARG